MLLHVPRTAHRAAIALLAMVAVVAGLTAPPPSANAQVSVAASATATAAEKVPTARLADMSGFRAGNIIDDSLFWDASAMTEAEIQAFLNAKGGTCAAGYTCLKSYTQTTRTIPASPMCGTYTGAPNETAARIIFKVAQACGVSPKVILVILQKEQGLVTHTSPSAGRYRAAMGAGCPDTAPCDADYYGFFDQVHYGAFLLKRYTQPPGTGPGTDYPTRFDLRYAVGTTSAIQYHPDAARCGTTPVFVENQATHALYVYTPYTPNPAALATSYSTGDPCSSYGNRNFYSYYSDWFGTVRGPNVGVYFRDYYAANSAWLGYATSAMLCGRPDSGCVQTFQGGVVAGSYSTAAAGVPTAYAQQWGWYGREGGPLGYPTTERRCDNMTADGCRQEFTGGWIVTFGERTTVILGSIREVWSGWGRDLGPIGTPTSDRTCVGMANGACRQEFAGGWIVEHGAISHFVPTAVLTAWGWYGREGGPLGLPTGLPSADPRTNNYSQTFQGGTITVTDGTPALTASSDPWTNAILTSPWLGTATASRACTLGNSGCYQPFQGGWVVQSAGGVAAVPTSVVTGWGWYGREYGILGFPVAAATGSVPNGTFSQTFQGGTITVTDGAPALTATSDPWLNAQLSSPWLGTATGPKTCTLKGGACYQPFPSGWIVQSPAGSYAVPTASLTGWGWYGRELNFLGFPTSAPSASPSTGNYTQTFQGGTITVTNGTPALTAATDPWVNAQLSSPWLGTATGPKTCTLKGGACYQPFQSGWIVQSPAGSYAVPTLAVTWWGWYGRELDVLGFPTAPPVGDVDAGTYSQAFQGGTVTVSGGSASVDLP